MMIKITSYKGFSIPTAVLTVAIVFVAATSLLSLAINQLSSTSRNIAAIRAYYNAKKGITAAVNVLNRDGQLPLQPDGTKELRTADFTARFSNNTNTLTSTGRTRTTGFRIPRTLTKTITVKLIGNLETYKFEESFSSARFKDGSSTASWTDDGNLELKYENISEPPYWKVVSEIIDVVDTNSTRFTLNAIDVDSQNRPHIAYYNNGVRYAKWNGSSWENTNLGGTIRRDHPQDISLKLDRNNRPVIAWHDIENNGVKVARWTGSRWDITSPGSWIYSGISVAIDSSNNPRISYVGSNGATAQLYYARWTGSSWATQSYGSSYRGEGYLCSSLGLDSSNAPSIGYNQSSYRESYEKSLFYTNTNFYPPYRIGDSGTAEIQLVVDSSNVPHIAYLLYGSYDGYLVRYTKKTGGWWQWQSPETVDNYGWNWWIDLALDLDTNNNPHIVYPIGSGGTRIRYATKSGGWSKSDIATLYAGGLSGLDLALDRNNRYQVTYGEEVYDARRERVQANRVWYLGHRLVPGKTKTGYSTATQKAISKILLTNQAIRKAKVVVTPTTSSNGQITFTLNNGASQLSSQNNVQLLNQSLTFDFNFPTLGNNLSYQINLSNNGNSTITPQINHLTIYYIVGDPYTIDYKTWRTS